MTPLNLALKQNTKTSTLQWSDADLYNNNIHQHIYVGIMAQCKMPAGKKLSRHADQRHGAVSNAELNRWVTRKTAMQFLFCLTNASSTYFHVYRWRCKLISTIWGGQVMFEKMFLHLTHFVIIIIKSYCISINNNNHRTSNRTSRC